MLSHIGLILKVLLVFKHLLLQNVELKTHRLDFLIVVLTQSLVLHYECLDLGVFYV